MRVREDGLVVAINATLLSWTGLARSQVVGRRFDVLCTLPTRILLQTHLLPLLMGSGRGDELHLTLRGADGAPLPVLANAERRALPEGVVIDWLVLPMRQRHRFEQELLDARRAADAANAAKSEFLSLMSHELRTPLNAIIGFTRILHKSPTVASDARARDFLARVEANGRHLLALINQLLDLTRIEAGHDEPELAGTDVVALVREVVARLEGQPRAPGVALVVEARDGLAPIVTDAVRLSQVVVNLVGNALKFTHAGAVAVVVVDDGRLPVAIEVRDTGIGIPADRLEAIFSPFEQAERGTSRRYGGTGLGLAIARVTCARLGMTLTVRSTVSEGTTFRVDLPTSPTAP